MVNEFFDKLSRAADAFAEVMTEGIKEEQNIKLYTYNDFRTIVLKKQREFPQITKCTISVQKRKEFDDMFFADEKYIIRIVMLDDERSPICVDNKNDEFVGAFVIADSIDRHLIEFMDGKTEKTVVVGGK